MPASDGEGEYYYGGSFDLAIAPGNSEHGAFFRALFSLFGKFASNRHQTGFNPVTGAEYDPRERTSLWIGYEAIRWALEDSRRSFYHDSEHVRPVTDKWRAQLG